MHMEDPIVIPTAKSVQKTLKKNSSKAAHVPASEVRLVITENGSAGLGSANIAQSSTSQTEVREMLAVWQSNRSRQSRLLQSLEVGYSISKFLSYTLTVVL